MPQSATALARARAIVGVLGAQVYVVDLLLGLGDEGPFVQLTPRDDGDGRPYLPVYTARGRLPNAEAAFEAEAVPLPVLFAAVPPGVRLVIDPGARDLEVSSDDVADLARLITEVGLRTPRGRPRTSP